MSLNDLADEGAHGFERETFLKDSSATASGYADGLPQEGHPEVGQNKSQGHVKQAQHGILGGRADAGLMFEAIASTLRQK
jgi:hypothetical protein